MCLSRCEQQGRQPAVAAAKAAAQASAERRCAALTAIAAAAAVRGTHARGCLQMALARAESSGKLFAKPVVVLADREREEMDDAVRCWWAAGAWQ